MSKILYPIFKLPSENEDDVEYQAIPTWIKWWLLNNYNKKHSWVLSEIITGNPLTLENSVATKFYLPPLPRGNSEQVQLSGKNLAGPIQGSDEAEGVTIQVNGNTISFTGTTTDASTFRFIGNSVVRIARYFQAQTIQEGSSIKITPGTYILNYDGATVLAFYGDLGDTLNNSTAISKNTPFTITEDKYVWLGRYVANATQTNDTISNIQLEKSSTATSYEPYCGGTASPNPSYPQSISNVTGDVEVLVQNKNKFDYDYASDYSHTTVDSYRFVKIADVVKGQQYNINNLDVSNIENETGLYIYITYEPNYNGITNGNNLCSNSNKLSTANRVLNVPTTNSYYIGIYPSNINETTFNKILDKFKNAQLEQGSTASTYVAHEEQTYTFPLGTQRMYLGDYLADDGIHHVRKQVVLDGTESGWLRSNTATSGKYRMTYTSVADEIIKPTTSTSIATLLCNRFIVVDNNSTYNDINGVSVRSSNGYIDFYYDEYSSSFEDFTTWLSTHNVTVEYELATEEITPYTTEQQQAYDEIKQAISYEEQTNISGSSDESNPIFEVQYYMKNESEGE